LRDRSSRPHLLPSLFERKAWGCSATEIEWRKHGFEGSRLGYLLNGAGLFHQAHRAVDDCHALLEILALELPTTGAPALAALLERARKKTIRVWAEQISLRSQGCIEAPRLPLVRRKRRSAPVLVYRRRGERAGRRDHIPQNRDLSSRRRAPTSGVDGFQQILSPGLRPSSSRTPKYAGQVDRGFDEVGPIAIKIARNSRGARRRLHAIWWPSASSLKLKPARDTTHSQAGIRRHFQGPSRKWEKRAAVPGLSPLPQRLWLPGEACEIKAEDTALYRREKSKTPFTVKVAAIFKKTLTASQLLLPPLQSPARESPASAYPHLWGQPFVLARFARQQRACLPLTKPTLSLSRMRMQSAALR
jgi:hypothetical protein